MAWKRIPGLPGKVYIPEYIGQDKKHPCPDCFECQHCSQERCQVCRSEKPSRAHQMDQCSCALFKK